MSTFTNAGCLNIVLFRGKIYYLVFLNVLKL